jgi:transcriptional/translational regulatory protein YebC/TACO1
LMEAALEAGEDDFHEGDGSIEVVTSAVDFAAVRDALEGAGFVSLESSVTMEPSTTVSLGGKDAEQMMRLADTLEDLDDVQEFFANFDISEEEMEQFA